MIKSMTGYGVAIIENEQLFVKAEIKSLNSKNLECSMNIPKWTNSFEMNWRNLLFSKLRRGKITLNLTIDFKDKISNSLSSISEQSFIKNYNFLMKLTQKVHIKNPDIFLLALKYSLEDSSNLLNQELLNNSNSKIITDTINEAIQKCNEFREIEGNHLLSKFLEYVVEIKIYFEKIQNELKNRIEYIKNRIKNKINEITSLEASIDRNRFEQEILYYLEKLDIEEEIKRLEKHLSYFLEVLKNKESYCGKKLIFILQEISREVNTIGSKASDVNIQNNVVLIKENIEKIKEQLQNIL